MSVLFSTSHSVGGLIDRFILQYKIINTACLGYELQYDKYYDKYIKILHDSYRAFAVSKVIQVLLLGLLVVCELCVFEPKK